VVEDRLRKLGDRKCIGCMTYRCLSYDFFKAIGGAWSNMYCVCLHSIHKPDEMRIPLEIGHCE
jgi:hypothetical protein